MLSGIGMEQLRNGEAKASGLFSSALAFVAGFSVVLFLSAPPRARRLFLAPEPRPPRPDRRRLDPSLRPPPHRRAHQAQSPRRRHRWGRPRRPWRRRFPAARPALCRPRRFPFFLALAHRFFWPLDGSLAQSRRTPPQQCHPTGIWSGFLLGFAFAFGWTPCIGPVLATVLALAAASDTIARGVLLLAVYSAGLAIPFLLTAVLIGKFMAFYKNFRKYLHAVEVFSGALLLFVGDWSSLTN